MKLNLVTVSAAESKVIGMKSILFCAIFGCAFHAWDGAQGEAGQRKSLVDAYVLDGLRLVEDPDGHTNLRSGPSLEDKVVGQVPSGSVVFSWAPPVGDWLQVSSDDSDDEKPRYVHTSRLKAVKRWKQIGITDFGILKHEEFNVRVTVEPFVASEHRITRDAEGGQLVDGKHPWGKDGGLPQQALSVGVILHGKTIAMPKSAFDDLYEPNMDSIVLLTPSEPGDRALLLMSNSDGAGGYTVVWAFEKGRYCGRTVIGPP